MTTMYAWDFEWDQQGELNKPNESHPRRTPSMSRRRFANVILLLFIPLFILTAFYLTCLIHPRWLPFYHPFHLSYSHLSNSYSDGSIGKQLASIYNHVLGSRSETEGWYVKIHLPENHPSCNHQLQSSSNHTDRPVCEFAVIFLWYTDPQVNNSHSSIQFYDATNLHNHMYRRPLSSFQADPLPSWRDFIRQWQLDGSSSQEFINLNNNFSMSIGNNTFSLSSVDLNISPQPGDMATAQIQMNVKMQPSISLPSTHNQHTSFSSTSHTVGILGFLPLSCFQQMIAMKLDVLVGSLTINGQQIDITGSEAYIEKTWGRTFPKEYLWMHATRFTDTIQEFNQSINSLFFAVADVPMIGTASWPGFVSTLLVDDRYIHFSSHLGSIINMELSDLDRVIIQLYNKDFTHELIVQLYRDLSVEHHNEAWLYAAKDGAMNNTIKQQIGRDICTVTLSQLVHDHMHNTGASHNDDEFIAHGYYRVELARARTRAIGLEVMIDSESRLVKLIKELNDEMRPWKRNWIQLNTPIISMSLPLTAWCAILRMARESVSHTRLFPVLIACCIIILTVVALIRARRAHISY